MNPEPKDLENPDYSFAQLEDAIKAAAAANASAVVSIMRILKCDLQAALRIMTAYTEMAYYRGAKSAVVSQLDDMIEDLKKKTEEQAKKDKEERESSIREALIHPDLADPGKEEEPAK